MKKDQIETSTGENHLVEIIETGRQTNEATINEGIRIQTFIQIIRRLCTALFIYIVYYCKMNIPNASIYID